MSFLRSRVEEASEPLGVLLLPCQLEDFDLADHARDLLLIPRVIAVEPPRRRVPRFLRDSLPVHQAKRLRFPGAPRVLVLYHPAQYALARSLVARNEHAELWYVGPDVSELGHVGPDVSELGDALGYKHDELLELDQLARGRARQTIAHGDDALRYRLRELQIISPRPFVPGGRIQAR